MEQQETENVLHQQLTQENLLPHPRLVIYWCFVQTTISTKAGQKYAVMKENTSHSECNLSFQFFLLLPDCACSLPSVTPQMYMDHFLLNLLP
jgi:hypothetical protein